MKYGALVIMMLSALQVTALEIKYFGKGYKPDPLELLSRMSLDDIIRYRRHTIDGFLGFCLLTMSAVFS